MRSEEKEIREELVDNYGIYLTVGNIGTVLGVKYYPKIYAFMDGVPSYMVGKTVRYRAADVARRIYESRRI